MKRLFCVLAILGCLISPLPAGADQVMFSAAAAPPPAANPVLITVLRLSNHAPTFIQIYNTADTVTDLHGWQLVLNAHSTTSELSVNLASFSSWIVPHGYAVLGDASVAGADINFSLDSSATTQLNSMSSQDYQIIPASGAVATSTLSSVNLPGFMSDQWLQRTQTSADKYNNTGKVTDFKAVGGPVSLYGSGLYAPPDDTGGLQILEIMPHPSSCAPGNSSLLCSSYVKLYNSSNKPIELSAYRLRTSYGGIKSSSSNTINLDGSLSPNTYALANVKNDGSVLALTQSGGYVWLEDIYGVNIYQPVITYPDASASSREAWSWALNGQNWQWSSMPSPLGANAFTADAYAQIAPVVTTKECPAGQARNPATGRCRQVVNAAASTPTSCKPGQERNQATGRCRSLVTATTAKKPCVPGQVRNPETGRCRKDTKVNLAAVHDIKSSAKPHSNKGLVLVVGAVGLALAYAIYEWRQEISQLIRRFKLLVPVRSLMRPWTQ